jgi:hypothetical protein
MLTSRGGELHTFTRVQNFGGGIVPLLNDLSGNPVVAPECAALGNPAAGSTALPAGKTQFQCCIHPWMRTTIEVKSHK